MPFVSYPRNHCHIQHLEAFPLFSSKSLRVIALTFKSLIHFELIFVYGVLYMFDYGVYDCIRFELHSFACGYPVFSALFLKEIVLSPFGWSWPPCQKSFDHICKGLLLCSLVHQSLCLSVPEPHYFDYCSTVVINFEISKCESSNIFLFFFQECFGYLGSLEIPYKF